MKRQASLRDAGNHHHAFRALKRTAKFKRRYATGKAARLFAGKTQWRNPARKCGQELYYDPAKYDMYLTQLGIKYPTVRSGSVTSGTKQ